MKIIITEAQLKMLELLKEGENTIADYNSRLVNITNQLNKTYNSISFINVAELINGEVEINPIYNMVNSLDAQNSKISDEFEQYFKSFDEDTYYDKWAPTHNALDKVYYKNMDKINVLLTIIADLGNFVDDNEKTKEVFSDIESINLG
jgi:hypothetical protein